MDDTNTPPEGDATNEMWQAEAGAGRPLPGARLLDIGRIRRARPQPRAWFDPDELRDLAASIGEHGILAPLIVRPDLEHPGEFRLVVGERRLRAAREIGLAEVPVLIRAGISNDEAFIEALVENLQRADLTADERFNALKWLEGRGLSQREIGRRLGYDHTTVNRRLRIHGDPVLGPAVATAQITASQGQELLQAPPAEQGSLIAMIVARRGAGRAIRMGELRAAVKAIGEELAARDWPPTAPSLAPDAPSGSSPAPSEPATVPEGLEGRELRRMVARARTLKAHVQQELAALLDYRHHPWVREELDQAQGHIVVALRD
jgi:ParB/RepB/Spo0J family partition protein